MSPIFVRAAVVIALLTGTAVLQRTVTGAERAVAREPLASIPMRLDAWQGAPATALPRDVVAVLGVDDHVYRTYVKNGLPVNLYAGYYGSQRRGDAIHSPQNCLPGAGWQPVASDTVEIGAAPDRARVNRYVIQKGPQKQVVLYWYQGRGRVVANEYANKALLMWDAATRHQTSGGLVRIITPVTTSVEAATEHAAAFASTLLPKLQRVMP